MSRYTAFSRRLRFTPVVAVAGTASTIAAVLYYNNKDSRLSSVLSKPFLLLHNDAQDSSSSVSSSLFSPLFAEDPASAKGKIWSPPSRKEMLNVLKGLNKDGSRKSKSGNEQEEEEYDLLIIGAGATGAGCALDAATRGLKVACVERDDFASGTSSRSTKLVHGGVRYLEKAFLELDYEQYKLVREALHERSVFLKIAPYLSYQLPIMLPIYKLWKVPYYWAGSKAYDILAGGESLESSYFLTKTRALEAFPMLKKDSLKGAMVYYDGAHNDSRMNISMVLTAIAHGAVVANHTEVIGLKKAPRPVEEQKDGFGPEKIVGATLRDMFTGETWDVKCKGVINATGPFTDGIRKLDEPQTSEIVAPSAGVHIILPNYYSPAHMGLVDPQTSDGRVIFFLPWQGNTIAGTTDSPTDVTPNPMPSEKDIQWILKEVQNYLSPDVKVRRGDVLAAWSGIRPLVRDPGAKNTAALVRNHMINVSKSGLLTIAGGKWTTYRAMAEETIDKAIEVFNLKPTGPCVTTKTLLIGSHHYSKTMYIKLIQHFGIETEIAKHLSESYGDRAWAVASLAATTGNRWPILGKRLISTYPYIEAEVRYACRREYAMTAVDVLARRTRLAFLNAQGALEALPKVIEIMAEEHNWSWARKVAEREDAEQFLLTMGLPHEMVDVKRRKAVMSSSASPAVASAAASAGWSAWLPWKWNKPAPENGSNETTAITTMTPPPRPTVGIEYFSRSKFTPEEIATYRRNFSELDSDGDGAISVQDLDKALKRLFATSISASMSSLNREELKLVVEEADLNRSGSIEFGEFLEVVGAVKDATSRNKGLEEIVENMNKLTTERSGGGV